MDICSIIYIKESNSKKFIVLDTGMNDMMRPALYNAYHKIIPLNMFENHQLSNLLM